MERHQETGGQISTGRGADRAEARRRLPHRFPRAGHQGEHKIPHGAGSQSAARQIKKGVGKDIAASRGAEDRVNCGLEVLAAQLRLHVQADEQAGDEVVTAGGQAHAATFQAPDAFEQVAVEDLLHAALDLRSIGPLETGPKVLPPLAVQEKGEAFGGGSLLDRFTED